MQTPSCGLWGEGRETWSLHICHGHIGCGSTHFEPKTRHNVRKIQLFSIVYCCICIVLKTVEDGICWYYYAHENNNLMDQSKLAAAKEDLFKNQKRIAWNWCDRCVHSRLSKNKVERLKTQKFQSFCCSTLRNSHGV